MRSGPDTLSAVAGGRLLTLPQCYWVGGGREKAWRLTSVVLPTPEMRQAAATMKVAEMLAVSPGTKVSLDVNLDRPEVVQQVKEALTARLKKNGVIVAENQPVHLVASSSPGESRDHLHVLWATRAGESDFHRAEAEPRIYRGRQDCMENGERRECTDRCAAQEG